MYPKLTFKCEYDGDEAITPNGAFQQFHLLNEEPLQFSKWVLELDDGLTIESIHLISGHLQINGRINHNTLLISFFEKHV